MSVSTRVLNGAVVASLGLDLVLLVYVVALEAIGEAEVDEIGLVVALEHEVGALDVAMSVAARMHVLESVEHLTRQTQHGRLADAMRTVRLVEHRLQIAHIALHHQKAVLARAVRAQARRDILGHRQMLEALGASESFH